MGEGGGLVVMRTTATLTNALFQGNSAVMNGGAINISDSYFTMMNATISGNHSGGNGGGVSNREVFFDGEMTMSNSIIWGNTAEEEGNEIYNCETCVIYSLNNLYGNNPGDVVEGETFAWDNSLSEDPLFLNPAAGNFRLGENSPAIDAGDPDTDLSYFPGGPDVPVDLSGNPRVYNSLIDMGAYEYQGVQECVMPTDISIDNITTTAADISWTENGTATEWEIEYGEFGFTPGEGITITDNDGTLGETISGLISGMEYDVYVRSLCGENESEWEGPVSFNTQEMGLTEVESQILLYPNPTPGIVNIQTKEKINSVYVYNAAGQKVPFNSLNKENTSIDISNLPKGAYFVEINFNNKAVKKYKVIRK